MIDLEALGHSHDCIVVSAGIVKFNLMNGNILDKKYWELNLKEQKRIGRTIDVTTVQWWALQSENTRKALSNRGRTDVFKFLHELREFIKEPGYYWAKGTNYDLAILENLNSHFNTSEYSQGRLFKYSKWCDARVMYLLDKEIVKLNRPSHSDEGHNALADAEFQTKVVCKVYNALKNNYLVKKMDKDNWL